MPRACLEKCPEDGDRCQGYEEEPHEEHYHYLAPYGPNIGPHKWKGKDVFAHMIQEAV